MRFSGSQTVYPCKEHDIVSVPFRLLLGADGGLDIYPEVARRGYFDIDYSQGRLVLRSKGFVGLIPISDRVVIHVEPRAPIGNLLYMIGRAALRPTVLAGFIRGYQDQPGAVDSPEDLYVTTFLHALAGIRQRGALKRYCAHETVTERRGRLLFGKTVSRFYAKGLRDRQVWQVHDLTVNNRENQTLKHTTERLLRHFLTDPKGPNREVARQLKEMLAFFTSVESGALTRLNVAREAVGMILGLPRRYHFYEPALWLAYLIATKSGVLMESVGRARFDSLIVNMALVFENYVRKLCEEAVSRYFSGCTVFDGNKRDVPLFCSSGMFPTRPDYYFSRSGAYVAVADAKYKPNLSTGDRYELLAFCEALDVSKAAFVCPQVGNSPAVSHHGTTRSGRELYVLRIDLGARDMAAEEKRFQAELGKTLGLCPLPVSSVL